MDGHAGIAFQLQTVQEIIVRPIAPVTDSVTPMAPGCAVWTRRLINMTKIKTFLAKGVFIYFHNGCLCSL